MAAPLILNNLSTPHPLAALTLDNIEHIAFVSLMLYHFKEKKVADSYKVVRLPHKLYFMAAQTVADFRHHNLYRLVSFLSYLLHR